MYLYLFLRLIRLNSTNYNLVYYTYIVYNIEQEKRRKGGVMWQMVRVSEIYLL
jgi:hypothetical protein